MKPVAGLHVLGRLPESGVAIVGSRTPPPEAFEYAYELARRIGEPVIAGLARGIDTAAHRGALSAGMPTVAFVGYGFGRTFPPENAGLEREIVERGGAIATLCAPGVAVTDDSSIERDRLQADYARAVILICSEVGGGAMHTLRFARELRRPNFAVVPSLQSQGDPHWGGNVRALESGASPLPFNIEEAIPIIHATRAR